MKGNANKKDGRAVGLSLIKKEERGSGGKCVEEKSHETGRERRGAVTVLADGSS